MTRPDGAILAEDVATAVFVANDQMSLGLLHACFEAGVRVPDDLSVIGFDDIPEAAFFTPALTTVRQDFEALGHDIMATVLDVLRERAGCPRPHRARARARRAGEHGGADALSRGLGAPRRVAPHPLVSSLRLRRRPPRSGSSCRVQRLPSGSRSVMNRPQSCSSTPSASTPFARSSASTASASGITTWITSSVPGSSVAPRPFADGDRARRSGRGELHEAQVLADARSWSALKPSLFT